MKKTFRSTRLDFLKNLKPLHVVTGHPTSLRRKITKKTDDDNDNGKGGNVYDTYETIEVSYMDQSESTRDPLAHPLT